jgi:hypothetical protein
MDGVAEVGSAIAGAVSAGATGAESAAVATAPAAVATVEGTAIGAVAATTPAVAEVGTGGVTTAVESSGSVAAQGLDASADLAANAASAGLTPGEASPEQLAETMASLDAIIGEASPNIGAESPLTGSAAFAKTRALGRGEEITKEERGVPDVVKKEHAVDYNAALEKAKAAAVSRNEDPNSANVQREALDNFYYELACNRIKSDPRILQRIMNSTEAAVVYMQADQEVNRLVELRRGKGEAELSQEELDLWKLAIYYEMMHRKKKKVGWKTAIAAAVLSMGKSLFTESAEPAKNELTGQRAR